MRPAKQCTKPGRHFGKASWKVVKLNRCILDNLVLVNLTMKDLQFAPTRYSEIYRRFRNVALPACLAGIILTIGACASSGNVGEDNAGRVNQADRILACKNTDRLVDNQNQCLQDDAACYQIKSGQWCTGPRGNICPAGSVPLTTGSECPLGSRCFRVSESLECRI